MKKNLGESPNKLTMISTSGTSLYSAVSPTFRELGVAFWFHNSRHGFCAGKSEFNKLEEKTLLAQLSVKDRT